MMATTRLHYLGTRTIGHHFRLYINSHFSSTWITMRFVSRLHVCAAASILMILYFTWVHSSYFENTVQDTVQTVWRGTAHRVVVFGNDWSNTGSYRVSSSAPSVIVARDADRGDLWVETICEEVRLDQPRRGHTLTYQSSHVIPSITLPIRVRRKGLRLSAP
jgi:hypothetical protein